MFTDYQKKVLVNLQLRGVLWQQDLKKLTGIENVHKVCYQLEKKGLVESFRVGLRLYWKRASN